MPIHREVTNPGALSVSVEQVAQPDSSRAARTETGIGTRGGAQKKIWIDLDNSPHVPFFLPIIDEIRARGHKVFLTARDSYQVCELLKLHNLSCSVIGHHWGKHRALKVIGTCVRMMQLMPHILSEKPDLAVSHGSRAQLLTGFALRIPTVTILDYEFTAQLGPIRPDWVFMPDLIQSYQGSVPADRILRYPGLKEDVYAARLKPDPSLRAELGLSESDLVVIVRPPATEAHYHNPESETLFDAALNLLIGNPEARVVLLPRNDRQAQALRVAWREWIDKAKIVIPDRAVDGLNLIWASDLVISGGGTMNREAAALGVPVYSIFRGRIGAVDRYLSDSGRLTLLESAEDVRAKIALKRRNRIASSADSSSVACRFISEAIISIAEHHTVSTDSSRT